MVTSIRTVVAICVTFATFGWILGGAHGRSLVQGNELETLLTGKTLVGAPRQCQKFSRTFAAIDPSSKRGRDVVVCDDKTDKATWRLEGQGFCVTYVEFHFGDKNYWCFTIRRESDGTFGVYRGDGSKTPLHFVN